MLFNVVLRVLHVMFQLSGLVSRLGLYDVSRLSYEVGALGWRGRGFTQLSVTKSVRWVGLAVALRSDCYAVGLLG